MPQLQKEIARVAGRRRLEQNRENLEPGCGLLSWHAQYTCI